MKIALFSDTYPPQINGVATATATLAEVLKAHGSDVLVVTTCLEGQRHLSYQDGVVRIPGITLKRLYNYKFAGFFSTRVYNILKDFKPDLIHIQTEAGVGIFGRIASFNLHVPLVYTYHTMYEDYTYYVTKGWKPFDRFAKKVVATFSAMIGDWTTEFVTTSQKTKEALRRYGVKKYINVVPNGIDLSAFQESQIDQTKKKELVKKYGLEGKYVVLILGRLAKEKDNETVLAFLRSFWLKKTEPDMVLLIVGDGPDKKNLMAEAEKLEIADRVIFTGAVSHSDVPYFYSIADLYVSASTSETQGLTYIEAMASKTLVLARKDENLLQVIIDNQTGFFFTDEISFIQKLTEIRQLSQEKKAKIIQDAYDNDMKLFSLDIFYERISHVYNKAIKKYW
jgi:1,2-diacylglycerol 3-alpha-glucosyltransferase